MSTTLFQLDGAKHREIKIAAAEDNISMGEAIRQAIDLWLEQRKKRQGKRQRRR
ncbi:MAG: ribbon-helix-helix protein, CopG family [Candidatus Binatia bacterium]